MKLVSEIGPCFDERARSGVSWGLMMEKVRAHVLISGRVQGVFFRAYTQEAAQARGVYGWVRNTRDGRVEAVLEGEKGMVEDMISWCHQGSPMSHVTKVTVDWEEFAGEFDDFSMRYSY
jgi:acylphosphatase